MLGIFIRRIKMSAVQTQPWRLADNGNNPVVRGYGYYGDVIWRCDGWRMSHWIVRFFTERVILTTLRLETRKFDLIDDSLWAAGQSFVHGIKDQKAMERMGGNKDSLIDSNKSYRLYPDCCWGPIADLWQATTATLLHKRRLEVVARIWDPCG